MGTRTITLRLDDKIVTLLDDAAAIAQRSRNWMASKLIEEGMGVSRESAPKITARAPRAVASAAKPAADVPTEVIPARAAKRRSAQPATRKAGVSEGLCPHNSDPRFCRIGECAANRDA